MCYISTFAIFSRRMKKRDYRYIYKIVPTLQEIFRKKFTFLSITVLFLKEAFGLKNQSAQRVRASQRL